MGLKIATFTIAAQQAAARAYYKLQHDWHMVDYANHRHFVECPKDFITCRYCDKVLENDEQNLCCDECDINYEQRHESDEYHNVRGNGYDSWS